MDDLLTPRLRELRGRTEEIARAVIAPRAQEVDERSSWPAHAFRALADAGLLGLQVPTQVGGHGQGLLALAITTEVVAQACSSSALCYGMHCVGTAVIAAKATPYQTQHYLEPIAQGQHITTLSASETGSGVHFYLPETRLTRENDDYYLIDGTKQFVTSGGHADSYVVTTKASATGEIGEFSCLLVERDLPGVEWLGGWRGMGMRGNSSRGLRLNSVRVARDCLLGEEGDQIWYAFEVIAPYFLMAMSASYLGIAQQALDLTLARVKERRYSHSGEALSDVSFVQHRLARMWTAVQKTRGLIYRAARLGDAGEPGALAAILACKADVADTVIDVTNEAMAISGGAAYRENAALARLVRDAHAAHIMAPTTDMLRQWLGRALLGLPLL